MRCPIKLQSFLKSRLLTQKELKHLQTLKPEPHLVGTLNADLLAKSLSDSSNEIEDLNRFLKEIVASAS